MRAPREEVQGQGKMRDFICNHLAAEDPLGAQLGQAERWVAAIASWLAKRDKACLFY